MRRALIADIHGNLTALEAVLRDIELARADEVVCLGDMIGYGPDPAACVDLVRSTCKWSLLGDHEARVLGRIEFSLSPPYLAAVKRDIQVMTPRWYRAGSQERWKWLESLLPHLSEGEVSYVHATPRDPLTEFAGPHDFGNGTTMEQDVYAAIKRVCFAGHSHYPGLATVESGWRHPSDSVDSKFEIDPLARTFVNVGSVGQPRDRSPKSCYCLWDVDLGVIEFRRVAYDLEATRKRFRIAPELDRRFYDRLVDGS